MLAIVFEVVTDLNSREESDTVVVERIYEPVATDVVRRSGKRSSEFFHSKGRQHEGRLCLRQA